MSTFCGGGNNLEEQWIYVYESAFCKSKNEKVLNLKHEIKVNSSTKVILKRGTYVLFLEIGKKRIGEFFNGNSVENLKGTKGKKKSHCFTVFSSQ